MINRFYLFYTCFLQFVGMGLYHNCQLQSMDSLLDQVSPVIRYEMVLYYKGKKHRVTLTEDAQKTARYRFNHILEQTIEYIKSQLTNSWVAWVQKTVSYKNKGVDWLDQLIRTLSSNKQFALSTIKAAIKNSQDLFSLEQKEEMCQQIDQFYAKEKKKGEHLLRVLDSKKTPFLSHLYFTYTAPNQTSPNSSNQPEVICLDHSPPIFFQAYPHYLKDDGVRTSLKERYDQLCNQSSQQPVDQWQILHQLNSEKSGLLTDEALSFLQVIAYLSNSATSASASERYLLVPHLIEFLVNPVIFGLHGEFREALHLGLGTDQTLPDEFRYENSQLYRVKKNEITAHIKNKKTGLLGLFSIWYTTYSLPDFIKHIKESDDSFLSKSKQLMRTLFKELFTIQALCFFAFIGISTIFFSNFFLQIGLLVWHARTRFVRGRGVFVPYGKLSKAGWLSRLTNGLGISQRSALPSRKVSITLSPKMAKIKQNLMRDITMPIQSGSYMMPIVCLYGFSGVGKSLLVEDIAQTLDDFYHKEPSSSPKLHLVRFYTSELYRLSAPEAIDLVLSEFKKVEHRKEPTLFILEEIDNVLTNYQNFAPGTFQREFAQILLERITEPYAYKMGILSTSNVNLGEEGVLEKHLGKGLLDRLQAIYLPPPNKEQKYAILAKKLINLSNKTHMPLLPEDAEHSSYMADPKRLAESLQYYYGDEPESLLNRWIEQAPNARAVNKIIYRVENMCLARRNQTGSNQVQIHYSDIEAAVSELLEAEGADYGS